MGAFWWGIEAVRTRQRLVLPRVAYDMLPWCHMPRTSPLATVR